MLNRKRAWEILECADDGDAISRAVDLFIMALIIANVAAIILESEEWFLDRFYGFFLWFEVVSVMIFTVEYGFRVWSCTADQRYQGAIRGRLRYMISPMAIIDLVAIVPFFLPFVTHIDLRMLRILRLSRLFRLLKLARYSDALMLMGRVFRREKEMIVVSFFVMLMVLIFSSSAMYAVENAAQPDAFGSILDAMWWAVAALTTVGYGDVYPVTALGKFLGAMIAMVGIAMFALPAGILASGFLDELEQRRATDRMEEEDRIDSIERLHYLMTSGALTSEEYEQEKGRLLER